MVKSNGAYVAFAHMVYFTYDFTLEVKRPMKKIALLLCSVLVASSVLYGCNKTEPVPEAASSSGASSGASSAGAVPATIAEITAHNDKIDAEAIDLIQSKTPAAGSPTATIKTSLGDIKIVLYPNEAPKAVENFTELAKKGYYNGQKFYEVSPDVHISAGSPDDGKTGKSADGKTFEDEYSLNLWHFNGAVAMNNGGLRNQNDSRFFIVSNATELSDEFVGEMADGGYPPKVSNRYLEVGGVPNYDSKDTVFGQVIEGMDIVTKIAAAECAPKSLKPATDITITAVEIGTL